MKSEADNRADMLWNPKKLLDYWLTDMTHVMDRYMRSPAFLEWLRHSVALHARISSQLVWTFRDDRAASGGERRTGTSPE